MGALREGIFLLGECFRSCIAPCWEIPVGWLCPAAQKYLWRISKYSQCVSKEKKNMLRHIVFFKFKPDTPPERRENFVDMLRALPGQIPGIVAAEVGEDILHKERSFDVALNFTFKERTALDSYTPHPKHVSVVEESHRVNEKVCAVDYWVE
jgi:hypothetical protein